MSVDEQQDHWTRVYQDKAPENVSWYQAAPEPSLPGQTPARIRQTSPYHHSRRSFERSPGDQIGEVESVKATSEVFTAVGGAVIEVNSALVDHPELINDDAFEEGWIVRIKAESIAPLEAAMSAKEYTTFIKNAT